MKRRPRFLLLRSNAHWSSSCIVSLSLVGALVLSACSSNSGDPSTGTPSAPENNGASSGGLFGSGDTPEPTATIALPTVRPSITPRATPTLSAATPPPPNVPIATPTAIVYVVQSGDTPIEIANKFGVSAADLIAANDNLDATRLQIGQSLIIPNAQQQQALQSGALLPSPTPEALQVQGINVFRTAAGSLECLGEVFNPGQAALNNVQLQVNLLDEAGSILKSATFFVALEVIPPNNSSPFRILFTDPPPTYSKVSINALRGEAIDPATRYTGLKVNNPAGAVVGQQYKVNGEVENSDNVAATKVRVIVTTYSDQNVVIGYRYITLNDMNPGDKQPFEVLMTSSNPNVARFAAVAEGLKP